LTSTVSAWNTPSPPSTPSTTTPWPALNREGTPPVLTTLVRAEPSVTTKWTEEPMRSTDPGRT